MIFWLPVNHVLNMWEEDTEDDICVERYTPVNKVDILKVSYYVIIMSVNK
jgi:hypothetical protein